MRSKTLLLVVMALVVGGGVWLLSIRQKSQAPPAEVPESQEGQISTFTLSGYGEGAKRKWQVEGRTADIFSQIVQLDEVVAKSYGDERTIILTSDVGHFDKGTNDVHLEQNVVATTSDGIRVFSDRMDWKAKEERMSSDGYVVVQKDKVESVGTGAHAEPGLKTFQLEKEVTVRVKPATVITCSGPLEVDYANGLAVFRKDVKVTDERGTVYADRMDVHLDPQTQKILKVVAGGNVRIVRGQNQSFSDEAVYFPPENKVLLSGNPKLTLYPKQGGGMSELPGLPGLQGLTDATSSKKSTEAVGVSKKK